VQDIEIRLPPACCDEAEPGDQQKQRNEDDGGRRIHDATLPQGTSSMSPGPARDLAFDQIDDKDEQGADENPGQLIPIEEGDVAKRGLHPVVGGHRDHRDERNEKKQARQVAPPAPLWRLVLHGASSPARLLIAAGNFLKAWEERDCV
jgi:hypothetical protein